MATQSLKCDGWKNGTVDSVRRTNKLCCYGNAPNRGHVVFACHESTLAVHSENPFMVSNITTGNSGQLKMPLNSVRRKNRGFGFDPIRCTQFLSPSYYLLQKASDQWHGFLILPHKAVVYNDRDGEDQKGKAENVDLMILDDIQQLRKVLDGLIALTDNCEIFFNNQTERIENGPNDYSNV